MPTVSVVIPTYNRAVYVRETIESVLAQTYRDYEIIVVDDGSTDDTRQVLQPLAAAGKIRYVYQDNRGESAARNHGIRLAEGRYIAFLDSDDLILPERLEKQVAFLNRHPEVGLVHSRFSRFGADGKDLGVRSAEHLSGWVYPRILLDWSVLIPPSCVLVRAGVLAEVGGFDPSLRWGPDLDMWRRISRRYPFGVIPEVLTRMRYHPGSVSVDKVSAVASFERYLQKAFDEDPQLGPIFRRRAWAKLYSNAAYNILAQGRVEDRPLVRRYSRLALMYWPLQWSAYLGWLGAFVPEWAHDRLLQLWRKLRYSS